MLKEGRCPEHGADCPGAINAEMGMSDDQKVWTLKVSSHSALTPDAVMNMLGEVQLAILAKIDPKTAAEIRATLTQPTNVIDGGFRK